MSLEYCKGILLSEDCWAFEDYKGDAQGFVWFTDIVPKLKAFIHSLIEPRYIAACYAHDLFAQSVDAAFNALGVLTIKAWPMPHQKEAIALLNKHKFKHIGITRNNTFYQGRATEQHMFELHKTYWARSRRLAHG